MKKPQTIENTGPGRWSPRPQRCKQRDRSVATIYPPTRKIVWLVQIPPSGSEVSISTWPDQPNLPPPPLPNHRDFILSRS